MNLWQVWWIDCDGDERVVHFETPSALDAAALWMDEVNEGSIFDIELEQ